jgi:hypothetical protein
MGALPIRLKHCKYKQNKALDRARRKMSSSLGGNAAEELARN